MEKISNIVLISEEQLTIEHDNKWYYGNPAPLKNFKIIEELNWDWYRKINKSWKEKKSNKIALNIKSNKETTGIHYFLNIVMDKPIKNAWEIRTLTLYAT